MDSLTHSLTAYMMSRAGLNRWCPHATPVLLMAANVPDVDFLSALGGSPALLDFHRGPTHAVLWLPLVALAPLLPMLLFAPRSMKWGRAWLVSMLGVASHLLLDWTNIYGVRLLTPLKQRYYHLDIAAVIDPWLLATLVLCAGWFALSGLVSSEIGAAKTGSRGVAVFALLFLCFWQGGRFVLHERAVALLDSRIYLGAAPRRVAALPHFATPFRWTGLVETETAYLEFDVNLLKANFDPTAGRVFYKAEPSPAIQAARATDTFRRFLRFAQYPLWRVMPAEKPGGAWRVQVMDMRFGHPGTERFLATALIDRNLRVIEESFQFQPSGASR